MFACFLQSVHRAILYAAFQDLVRTAIARWTQLTFKNRASYIQDGRTAIL